MSKTTQNTQKIDALTVLGDEAIALIDELEAIIEAIGKGHHRGIVLKSEEPGAQFWAQLITEGQNGLF